MKHKQIFYINKQNELNYSLFKHELIIQKFMN